MTLRDARGIVIEGGTFGYPGRAMFEHLSLRIPTGSTAIFTGENGCGKSTLLYACAGLLPPASGTLRIEGVSPSERHPYELIGRGIRCGFVFEHGGLLSNMNVLANVALPLQYHADVLGLDPRAIEHRARAALRRALVAERDLFTVPARLSFGSRRRVALARALVLDPTHLFIDDPDVGLDPETASVLHRIIDECCKSPRTTTLIATHRPEFLDRLDASRYLLRDGVVVRAPNGARPRPTGALA